MQQLNFHNYVPIGVTTAPSYKLLFTTHLQLKNWFPYSYWVQDLFISYNNIHQILESTVLTKMMLGLISLWRIFFSCKYKIAWQICKEIYVFFLKSSLCSSLICLSNMTFIKESASNSSILLWNVGDKISGIEQTPKIFIKFLWRSFLKINTSRAICSLFLLQAYDIFLWQRNRSLTSLPEFCQNFLFLSWIYGKSCPLNKILKLQTRFPMYAKALTAWDIFVMLF